MSTAEDHHVREAPRSDLTADQRRAEGLLFDLATTLRRVPVEERTRALHLRALTLKGTLARWAVNHPDGPTCEAFCDEVMALDREANGWRGRLLSGTHIAHRDGSRDQGE